MTAQIKDYDRKEKERGEKLNQWRRNHPENLYVGLGKTQINLSKNGKSFRKSTHGTGQNLGKLFSNLDKFVLNLCRFGPNLDKCVQNLEKLFKTQINLSEFC